MFDFHTHANHPNAIINLDITGKIDIQKNRFYSAGLHPWTLNPKDIHLLNDLLSTHPNQIIAIGECGLDKIKSNVNLDTQVSLLRDQINLSEQYQKPLILHIVKCFNEIIQLKLTLQPQQKWIIHGFNNYKLMQSLLNDGFYLSFGPSLFNNPNLQNAFKSCPIDKIFIETDDSEADLKELYKFAAQLKKIDDLDLQNQIAENLKQITNGKLA